METYEKALIFCLEEEKKWLLQGIHAASANEAFSIIMQVQVLDEVIKLVTR